MKEEGDFWVELNLKEYREIRGIVTNTTGEKDKNGNTIVNQEIQKTTKETAKTYTTVSGDTLWKIAKLQLNDGERYTEIAKINNITDIDKMLYGLDEGTVLILP